MKHFKEFMLEITKVTMYTHPETLGADVNSDNTGKPILPVDFSFDIGKISFCPGAPWCEEIKGDCKTYVKYEYA